MALKSTLLPIARPSPSTRRERTPLGWVITVPAAGEAALSGHPLPPERLLLQLRSLLGIYYVIQFSSEDIINHTVKM